MNDDVKPFLALGLGGLVAFALFKMYKANTHQGAATPTGASGVLGTSPVLNPAAPKTTGDFARYDRALEATQVTPVSTHFHDPVYDVPVDSVQVSQVDATGDNGSATQNG